MNKHKNADWIIQWVNGVEVEMNAKINRGDPRGWFPVTNACSFENDTLEFRLKPKEIEWYENIPEHGVLCWVGDSKQGCGSKTKIAVIKHFKLRDAYHFKAANGIYWDYATPLTNDEIEGFKR